MTRCTFVSRVSLAVLAAATLALSAASCATYDEGTQPTEVNIAGARPAGKCKAGYGWDGTQCVGARVTTATENSCPPTAVWTGSACVRR